jgi:hypothetical protein
MNPSVSGTLPVIPVLEGAVTVQGDVGDAVRHPLTEVHQAGEAVTDLVATLERHVPVHQ